MSKAFARRGFAARVRERLRRLVDVETLLVVSRTTTDESSAPARLATAADLPALLELYGPGRLRLQRWRRRRRLLKRFDRGDTCLVVEADGLVVGCYWLSWSEMRMQRYRIRVRPREGEAYGYGLSVRPDFRGRGFGMQLLLAGAAHTRRCGGAALLGHISPRNPVTPHLFLEKRGDEVIGKVTVVVFLDRFGLPLPQRPVTAGSASAVTMGAV